MLLQNESEVNNVTRSTLSHIPARVLGCLKTGTLMVIVLPGYGLADGGILMEIAMEIVPFDLRMPNSEFDVVFDRSMKSIIQVLRKDE